MRTNPIFFWSTFAAIFGASLFIPLLRFKDTTVFVGSFYVVAAQVIHAGEGLGSLLLIAPMAFFHLGIAASLAMLATSVHRFLTGQDFQAPHVFSSPEPTRSEWDAFLAGRDDKSTLS